MLRDLLFFRTFLYSFWTIVVATTFEINGKIALKMIHAIVEKKSLLHKLLSKNRFLTAKNSIGWEEFPSTYTKTVNDKLRMCFKNSHAKLFFWPFFFLLARRLGSKLLVISWKKIHLFNCLLLRRTTVCIRHWVNSSVPCALRVKYCEIYLICMWISNSICFCLYDCLHKKTQGSELSLSQDKVKPDKLAHFQVAVLYI